MYLLLNNKELIDFLIKNINYAKKFADTPIRWSQTNDYISTIDEKYLVAEKFIPKFKERVAGLVASDLQNHIESIKDQIKKEKKFNFQLINDHFEYFVESLGKDKILNLYLKDNKQNFVKTVGFKLSSNPTLIRRKDFSNYNSDCLIRNTVGNEKLLVNKLDNNYPFWFIDSGYTNFLETRKTYHRLVRNHLHFGASFIAPVDRLGIFKKFPAQWRNSGEKILIVEPGPFAAACFHIDLSTWKYDIEKQLRQYTDKQIVFREKVDKKIRSNLHDEFCNEDYYCAISLNSNAATEAIWAGIPVITLGKHITNPVSRACLTDINNLYRPHLAQWLCMLSYSQFTYEELTNSVAVNIVKKYHV